MREVIWKKPNVLSRAYRSPIQNQSRNSNDGSAEEHSHHERCILA